MFLRMVFISIITLLFSSHSWSSEPVQGKQGMAVSEQALASEIGARILRQGGNAIDAAVAMGYALAVVNPCCGNLGGGGFMTLHLANGKNIFINFREKAPLAANTHLFLDNKGKVIPTKSTIGYLAVATPGTVMGLETALKKYGTLTRQQVMKPAIQLASQGYLLTSGDVTLLTKYTNRFKQQKNVAAIFLKNNKPLKVGDRLIQQDLAQTLKLISAQGTKAFYQGDIAKTIVAASQENGGILTTKDFSNYTVQELKPLTCYYRGYEIISAPPPSSGGATLCEILNILENYPLKKLGYHSAESVFYVIEAMRLAFADRTQLGDPDFITNPTEKLISKEYAKQLQQRIHLFQPTISGQTSKSQEGQHTTHYSVIDKMGNAASVTVTLNSFFGAKVIAGNTGFFLNNEMDDFTSQINTKNQFGLIQGKANSIQPGKRPLSSMTPTIILKNNKVVLVIGSPGGPRIITSTLLAILNIIEFNMNVQDAVNAPRFHHQWRPDLLYIEPETFTPGQLLQLKKMGYHIKLDKPWSAVEAIYIDPVSHTINGGSDKRRPAGKAVGF